MNDGRRRTKVIAIGHLIDFGDLKTHILNFVAVFSLNIDNSF